jgi:hypothetical protein
MFSPAMATIYPKIGIQPSFASLVTAPMPIDLVLQHTTSSAKGEIDSHILLCCDWVLLALQCWKKQ